jgi:HD-like signal output (HDOD) protein
MTFIGFDRPDLTVDDLLQGDVSLASPPETYIRLRRLVEQPDSTTAMMAEVIEHDPALAARVLKIANSAFFAMPHPIHAVLDAVNLVGIRELQQLVLATEVIRRFDAIPADLVDMGTYWRRSLRCAVLARQLASRRAQTGSEPLFIAALLHGIGHLVIYMRIPELGRKALLEHRHRQLPVHEAERAVMGFDYAAVGAALAAHWGLPEPLCSVLAHHLEPARAGDFRAEAAVVNIALAVSHAGTFEAGKALAAAPQAPALWEMAGLAPADLDAVLGETEEAFAGALMLLR